MPYSQSNGNEKAVHSVWIKSMNPLELYRKYRPKNLEQFLYFFSLFLSRAINRGKEPQAYDYRSILVSKTDEIGDVVLALPVFELLKQSYPQAEITAFCKPYTRDILVNNPHVSRVVTSEMEFAPCYDLIVELRGTLRSALFALWHPPVYRVDRGAVRWHNKRHGGHRHETEVNVQIIGPLLKAKERIPAPHLYLSRAQEEWAEEYIRAHQTGRFVILHPGARKPLKRWPPEKYAALADRFYEDGRSVVIVGMEEDRPVIEQIRALSKARIHPLVGEPLMHVAALAARAGAFVGNDSGPMHLAAAAGARVVGLFGPGTPEMFSPVGPQAAYIHHKLHCNPCDQVHCVYPDNPCMNRITVEEVLAAVTKP